MKYNNVKYNKTFFLCRSPLRISLFGGGSDLPSFIKYHGLGSVINLAIDKYVYTGAKVHGGIFEKKYRLNYFETENTNNINLIKNKIIKGFLKYYKLKLPFYINTISDVPAGTGLGSSASFLVSLCLIANKMLKKNFSSKILAYQATNIDLFILKSQSGYQDQYASAYGGFNEFIFKSNGEVIRHNLFESGKKFISQLEKKSLLIFTGKCRKSDNILISQNLNMNDKNMRFLVIEILNLLKEFKKNINSSKFSYSTYLELLDESWKIKKILGGRTSNQKIDNIYNYLKKNLSSCKLLGAGGGGFFLASFINEYEKNKFYNNNFNKFKMLEFKLESRGAFLLNK